MNLRLARVVTILVAIVALTSYLGSTGCSDAQSPPDPRESGLDLALEDDPVEDALLATDVQASNASVDRVARLAEILGMDQAQVEASLSAYGEFRGGLEGLREQLRAGELTRTRARVQSRILRDDIEAELQVILTEEQYDQLQERRQIRHHHRQSYRDPAARWADWMEIIGASEEQVADILAAFETLRDGMRDLHQQVRDGELSREEACELALALRADFDAALQDILTAEQYEQLMELRPDRHRP